MAHPQLVGDSFVSQYYNVLHQAPQAVHRFYTDSSSLTRAGPEESGIHDRVMDLDYAGLRPEIKTVDCQDSYSDSVLVMVTGSLSNRSNERRDFVQTFFLAPQGKGYFILNDIFRYLGETHYGMQEHSPTPESVSDPAHVEVSETGVDQPKKETKKQVGGFVSEYYKLLHHSPQAVHRFYTDSSRAEAGPKESGIHDIDLDYAGLCPEIKTVDCQDSYSGFILVMVTGSLSNRSNERRDFVQTFFLAPHPQGILNDIFRYLGEMYAIPNAPESAVSDPAHVEVSETVAPEEQQLLQPPLKWDLWDLDKALDALHVAFNRAKVQGFPCELMWRNRHIEVASRDNAGNKSSSGGGKKRRLARRNFFKNNSLGFAVL